MAKVIFFLLLSLQSFAQTAMRVEMYVQRVAMGSKIKECYYDKVLIVIDNRRMGIITSRDTLALNYVVRLSDGVILAENELDNKRLYSVQMFYNESGFIIFIVPRERQLFGITLSTLPCEDN